MRTLSVRQQVVARAVMAALFDDGAEGVPKERLDWALVELRSYVARVGLQTRLAFRAAFWVVQLSPLFLRGKLRRFVRLPVADRVELLLKLERSRLGLVVVLLKTICSMLYFEHPDALARTGYDGQGLLGPAWLTDEKPKPPAPSSHLPILPERQVAEGA